jgi:dUTP pyrophosphatase
MLSHLKMASLPNLPSYLCDTSSPTASRRLPFQTLGFGQFEDYSPWALRVSCPQRMTPTRGSAKSAGYDLRSPVKVVVPIRGSTMINTLCRVEMPSGHYGKIEGRSGLAVRHDIVAFGGVIDEDYRGDIHVKLFNHSDTPYNVEIGDRIAQMVIHRYANLDVQWVESLDTTARGMAGFGSSGR